ncbi:MAG: glycosyltransferase family 39 protein [Methanobrevibacter sp.]|jgi:4-amino-4-deoxy-L-arabinose transferase-like glycosyltransferase|nr:glycosyltransferase family 39 protein [Candidatus Methanoflexus mossambicus]
MAFNEKKLSLIFLTCFSVLIFSIITFVNSTSNVLGSNHVDIYLYLIYSLKFAGINVGYDYIIPTLSPLIPFLNSLVFRLGFINTTSIFIITGIFYIIGVLSSFFLFKLRFNNLISTLGATLFGGFYVVLTWTGIGSIDVPSVSLCILGIYLIMGQFKNRIFFYLGFVVLALSFLAKFTSLLMILVVFIYFLTKPELKNNFKI